MGIVSDTHREYFCGSRGGIGVDSIPRIYYNEMDRCCGNIGKEKGNDMKREKKRWLQAGILFAAFAVCIAIWGMNRGKTEEPRDTESAGQTEANREMPAELDKSLYMDETKSIKDRVESLF